MTKSKSKEKIDLLDINELVNADSVVGSDTVTSLEDDQVGPGKEISLHFSLALNKTAALIDSNFDKAAATFVFGDGSFLPGFERCLLGLRQGQKKTSILASQQAFGERSEDNTMYYPRYRFPADLHVEKGLMINFNDSGDNQQTGVVSDFDADQVLMDFNHPLAGREIEFKVEILSIKAITKLTNNDT